MDLSELAKRLVTGAGHAQRTVDVTAMLVDKLLQPRRGPHLSKPVDECSLEELIDAIARLDPDAIVVLNRGAKISGGPDRASTSASQRRSA